MMLFLGSIMERTSKLEALLFMKNVLGPGYLVKGNGEGATYMGASTIFLLDSREDVTLSLISHYVGIKSYKSLESST